MFNNNQFNSIKVFLLLVVIAGSGYFVINGVATRSNLNTGKVINVNQNVITDPGNPGGIANCTASVTLGSTYGDSCTVQTASCTNVTGTTKQCTGDLGNNYPCCCLNSIGDPACYAGTLGGTKGLGTAVKGNIQE